LAHWLWLIVLGSLALAHWLWLIGFGSFSVKNTVHPPTHLYYICGVLVHWTQW
jgi:hypothetical protein